MPKLGMIMTEGVVVQWLISPGNRVEKGQPLVEIMSDKLVYEVEAPDSGLVHPLVEEGGVVPVEVPIGYLLEEGEELPADAVSPPAEAVAPSSTHAPPQPPAPPPASEGGQIRASPAARRLARDLGVDLSQIVGSGPGGRIVEDDVRRFAEKQAAPLAPTGTPLEVIPLRGSRKILAQRMRRSLQESAQFTLSLEVDLTEAEMLRQRLFRGGERSRVTHTDLIVKAVAEALKRHPRLNSSLVVDEVWVQGEINIGVAVALDDGVVVPVVRQADEKNLLEIAQITADLTRRARYARLSPDETAGATFTVSMLGLVDSFTPILGPGQVAILGVGRVAQKPVVHRGEVAVRTMASLSLTVDHQVIDGAPAVAFLRRLKRLLETPRLLFEGEPHHSG